MLCKLEIKRTQDESGADVFMLRVSGKTALGPSGTGGRDNQEFANAVELRGCLRRLRLSDDLLMEADAILQDPGLREKFATLTAEEQIPFEVLEQAGFALFD